MCKWNIYYSACGRCELRRVPICWLENCPTPESAWPVTWTHTVSSAACPGRCRELIAIDEPGGISMAEFLELTDLNDEEAAQVPTLAEVVQKHEQEEKKAAATETTSSKSNSDIELTITAPASAATTTTSHTAAHADTSTTASDNASDNTEDTEDLPTTTASAPASVGDTVHPRDDNVTGYLTPGRFYGHRLSRGVARQIARGKDGQWELLRGQDDDAA